MNDSQRPVLVFGATGQQGGSVARALLRAQWRVPALVRDPAAPKSIALRAAFVELVRGTFANIDVVRAATKDAHGPFSLLPGNLAEK